MRIHPALAAIASICVGAFLLGGCVAAAPVQEMSDARQAITAAEEAGADRYAPDEIAEARRSLAEAETAIEAEAYDLARTSALRAQQRAMRALGRALDATEDD